MQPADRKRKGISQASISVCLHLCVTASVHPGDTLAASPLVFLWYAFNSGNNEKYRGVFVHAYGYAYVLFYVSEGRY